MATNASKKRDEIVQKIEDLKIQQKKIEDELLSEWLSLLPHTGALGVDMPTLLGGLLSVIDIIQRNASTSDTQLKEWQQTGQKFCRRVLKDVNPLSPSPKKMVITRHGPAPQAA